MTTPFDPLDTPLEPCAGDTHTDPQARVWTCHPIAGGQHSGRWAYYATPATPTPEDQQICATCGHYKHLHDIYSMTCAACDDPSLAPAKRCPAFKPKPKAVLADTLQNLTAHHFAGMLALPYDGVMKLGWVLGREWCHPVTVKLELEPKPEGPRFERLPEPPDTE